MLIGHPFNPPHVIPLVEVVPGVQTAPEAVKEAAAFYTALGKGLESQRLEPLLFVRRDADKLRGVLREVP
jgi:3-hydroxyacyl-CoA dehydrogenase